VPRGYRVAWWAVAGPASLLGATAAFLVLDLGALLLVAVVAGLILFFGWQLSTMADEQPGGPRSTAARLLAVGLLGGMAALAVVGMIAALGLAGWCVDAALAATGWPALRTPRRRTGPGTATADAAAGRNTAEPAAEPGSHRLPPAPGPAEEQLPPDTLPEPASLASLTTQQLCWAWRRSYLRVERATCASQLGHLAELRGSYLEELQRRDRAAFEHWLPTARAACDPSRVFCPRPGPGSRRSSRSPARGG
jgi:hypothetical protein